MISTPEFDIGYYTKATIDFFVDHYPQIFHGGQFVVGYLVGLALVLSFILVFGIIFSVEALKSIRKKEDKLYNEPQKIAITENNSNPEMVKKWNDVHRLMSSENSSDWRQAIIEADIMLGMLLVSLGYKGESIGEQLKRVVKGDFKTLDKAWEAHKVRNNIAHDGSAFQINNIEAQRVINLYQQVFEEFFHI